MGKLLFRATIIHLVSVTAPTSFKSQHPSFLVLNLVGKRKIREQRKWTGKANRSSKFEQGQNKCWGGVGQGSSISEWCLKAVTENRINFWKMWDEVIGIKLLPLRQHITAFSKSCAPPKKMWGDWRVWKGHKRIQKINPAGKVRAAHQKRDRIERWFENGLQEAKNPSLSKQHCSLCLFIYTIMSLNGKEKDAGQKLGEYLMLKKMPLTGVEISSLKVNESRYRNQERMGSVLGQRNRQNEKIWIFFSYLQASTGP